MCAKYIQPSYANKKKWKLNCHFQTLGTFKDTSHDMRVGKSHDNNFWKQRLFRIPPSAQIKIKLSQLPTKRKLLRIIGVFSHNPTAELAKYHFDEMGYLLSVMLSSCKMSNSHVWLFFRTSLALSPTAPECRLLRSLFIRSRNLTSWAECLWWVMDMDRLLPLLLTHPVCSYTSFKRPVTSYRITKNLKSHTTLRFMMYTRVFL